MSDQERTRVTAWDVLRIDIPKLRAANSEREINASPAARFLLRLTTEYHHQYRIRVYYCPPLPLLWNFRSKDTSPASTVHEAYARALWAERDLAGRLQLYAMFLLWPVIVGGTMVWFTALQGTTARTKTGKGVLRQAWEQLRMAAVHGILPPWYYMFELFDDARGRRAGLYLRRDETKGGIYRMLRAPGRKERIMKDKAAFANRCHENGVATPQHLLASEGRVSNADGSAPRLPPCDLFAKPREGRGGLGAEQWCFDGTRWSHDGQELDEVELLRRFCELSKSETYLIQHRLKTHRDLAELSGEVLSTVRVVTCRNETGGFEATDAAFRMPKVPEAKVDNFHAGGIAASVDMRTGELGPASDVGVRPGSTWHTTHPHSGATIEGRKLPYWAETLDLACRAHAAIPSWTVTGWDIAICDDGPMIIEGNAGADLDIIQRVQLSPLGDARLGELLAYHLSKLEAGA